MRVQAFTVVDENGEFQFGGRTTDVQAFELEPNQIVILGKFDPARCKFDLASGLVSDLPPVVPFREAAASVGREVRIEVPAGTCYDCRGGHPTRRVPGEWLALTYPEAGEYPVNLTCPGRAAQTITVKVTA